MVDRPASRRPFFQRAYAGFTSGQQLFYEEMLEPGQRLLDPMGGQAFALSQAASDGRTVSVGDINMAPLLLAQLRSPEVCAEAKDHARWLRSVIAELPVSTEGGGPLDYCDDWLPKSVESEVIEFSRLVGVPAGAPRTIGLCALSVRQRVALGMAVFCARELACFRASDNVTWTKPGGLVRRPHIAPVLLDAVDEWLEFAAKQAGRRGVVDPFQANAAELPESIGDADLVVTSPPYANRLDYGRMWGPEVAILSAVQQLCVWSADSAIGTNVVRGWQTPDMEHSDLPDTVLSALRSISADSAPYSATYYYPFFARYAIALNASIRQSSARVRAGGRMIVFVRDTTRRDTLFPTADIVRHAAVETGLQPEKESHTIVRRHIGLRRRNAPASVHGLAQREWTLVFKRTTV